MEFLEKDLEKIIYDANRDNPESLIKSGLHTLAFDKLMKRQLSIGAYGVADLVTFQRRYDYIWDEDSTSETRIPKLQVTVYELKKDKIGISAYLQALRYVRGLQRYFESRKFSHKIEFRIVLIGRRIDNSGSFPFIADFNENITFFTYSYGIDGLKFRQECNYHYTQENFKL